MQVDGKRLWRRLEALSRFTDRGRTSEPALRPHNQVESTSRIEPALFDCALNKAGFFRTLSTSPQLARISHHNPQLPTTMP